MAKTLQQVIEEKLSKKETLPNLDQQGTLERGLISKSGKEVSPQGPALSSFGQQTQQQVGQQALDQQTEIGKLQGLQQRQTGEEQKQAFDLQKKQQAFQSQEFKQRANQQMSALLQSRKQDLDSLNFKKAQASVEQIGVLARLSNDRYLSQLGIEASKDEALKEGQYKRYMLENSMRQEREILDKQMESDKLFSEDERQFREQLSAMDINTARALLGAQISQQQQSAQFAAGSQALSSVLSFYANREKSSVTPQSSAPTSENSLFSNSSDMSDYE